MGGKEWNLSHKQYCLYDIARRFNVIDLALLLSSTWTNLIYVSYIEAFASLGDQLPQLNVKITLRVCLLRANDWAFKVSSFVSSRDIWRGRPRPQRRKEDYTGCETKWLISAVEKVMRDPGVASLLVSVENVMTCEQVPFVSGKFNARDKRTRGFRPRIVKPQILRTVHTVQRRSESAPLYILNGELCAESLVAWSYRSPVTISKDTIFQMNESPVLAFLELRASIDVFPYAYFVLFWLAVVVCKKNEPRDTLLFRLDWEWSI